MNYERKMKKERKKLGVKPREEWLAENPDLAQYFTPEPTPKKRTTIPRWVFAPASFILVAAIILPVILSNVLGGDDTPPGTLPPITNEIVQYGLDDIDSETLTADFFSEMSDTLLIDLNNLSGDFQYVKEFPIEDSDIDLCYIFKEAIVPFVFNGNPYAVYLTYRIRVYEHYTFADEKYYKNLENEIDVGDYMINYQINKTQVITESFAHFNHNKNDYYLYVKEAQGIWPLNSAALQALLRHLFQN